MMAHLPKDKLQRICNLLAAWLKKGKTTKRDTLPGRLLQHATKVIKPGRTFVARMYSEAAHLRCLFFFTCLSKSFQSNFRWWHLFVQGWNGVNFLECSPILWAIQRKSYQNRQCLCTVERSRIELFFLYTCIHHQVSMSLTPC